MRKYKTLFLAIRDERNVLRAPPRSWRLNRAEVTRDLAVLEIYRLKQRKLKNLIVSYISYHFLNFQKYSANLHFHELLRSVSSPVWFAVTYLVVMFSRAARAVWGDVIQEHFNVDSSGDMNDLASLLLRGGNEEAEMSIKTVFYRQFLPASQTVRLR